MDAEIKERIEMINKGEVPKGYKRTKVGIIPEDWRVNKFGNLFSFSGGYPIPRAQLGEKGICYLHYGDIHISNKTYIDVEKNDDLLPKLSKSLEEIEGRFLLENGDIVFADASEDYEGIGKSVVIYNQSKTPFISGLHTIIAKDKTKSINREYKRYFLSNLTVRRQFMFYATGISVLGISQKNIARITIPLPALGEQQKIAQILSTWDEAIELKEKLIEKKKEQKKGLMQKLLTGEVRLPGFDGDWEGARLGEVSKMNSGGTPKSTIDEYYDGDIPWVSIADMTTKGKYINSTTRNISKLGLINSSAKLYPRGTVLYAMYASIGECSISRVELTSSQAILGIRPDHKLYNEFLYYYLTSIKEKIKKQGQQGTQSNLNAGMVKKLRILLPDIQEQYAIAGILSTADKEIELLEEELKLLKLQKKGLMQLLLTGIVRVKC